MKQAVLPGDVHKVERLKDFVHYGNIKFFPKGSTIFMPGESLKALIFVVVGKVKIVIVKDDGTELLFYTAETNQIMSRLFDESERILHGFSMEDTVVCFFTKEQLKEVFKEDDEIIFELLQNYTSKVAYFKNKLAIGNSASSAQKVYNLLLLLCSNAFVDQNPDTENEDIEFDLTREYVVDLSMSQKLVAEIIGVHPVTVSKVFNHLIKEKIISKKGRSITVHDIGKILELINENTEALDEFLK